jgi:hypothetical protein
MNKPGNEGDYVVCRILKDIDTFLGADLRTYDLKKEDTVTLPRKNAEVLQEKAVAKILIPPADNIGPAIQVIGSASAAIDCTPSPVPLEKDMKRIGKAIAEKSHDETRKMKFVLSRDKDGNPRVLDYSAIAAYIHEKYHVISFKGTARVYHDGIYIDGKETINHEIKEILDFLRYPKKILED